MWMPASYMTLPVLTLTIFITFFKKKLWFFSLFFFPLAEAGQPSLAVGEGHNTLIVFGKGVAALAQVPKEKKWKKRKKENKMK